MTGFINSLFKRKQKVDSRANQSPTGSEVQESVEEVPQSSVAVAELDATDEADRDLIEVADRDSMETVDRESVTTAEEVPSEEIELSSVAKAKPAKDSGTFFLDADRAKTLGDIDYMRTAKKVRKTFPIVGDETEGVEIIEQISSMEKGSSQPAKTTAAAAEPSVQPSKESADRRRQDSSMDMFRDMARNIKNKKS